MFIGIRFVKNRNGRIDVDEISSYKLLNLFTWANGVEKCHH
jgi:hypothetical protein